MSALHSESEPPGPAQASRLTAENPENEWVCMLASRACISFILHNIQIRPSIQTQTRGQGTRRTRLADGLTRCSHWGRGMGPGRGVMWKLAVRGKALRASIRKWRARGLLARWGIMQVRRRRHSYVHPTCMHYRTVLWRIGGARHAVGEMLLCVSASVLFIMCPP